MGRFPRWIIDGARGQPVRALMLGVGGGVAHALAFSPMQASVLAVLGLSALCLLGMLRPSLALLGAGAWGVAAFGTGVSWLYPALGHAGLGTLASVPVFLGIVATQAVFPVCSVMLLRCCFVRERTRLLAFPAVWTLLEFLRAHVPGFPWLLGGYAHVDTVLAQAAPIAGVWGVGFLAAALAALLAHGYRSTRLRWILPWVAVLCFPIGGTTLPETMISGSSGRPVHIDRVAVTQSAFERAQKRDPAFMPTMLEQYDRWSKAAADASATVVVWPEVALPLPASKVAGFLRSLHETAGNNGTSLLAGLLLEERGKFYNAVVGLGVADGRVDKSVLAPLGESVPPWLRALGVDAVSRHPLEAGSERAPIRIGEHAMAAVAICYELSDVELVRARARRVGDAPGYLVIASDESWFVDTWEPVQQLQMARMRALETGLPVLKSSNGGIAAVIDPSGRLQAVGQANSRGILVADASPARAHTPWLRWGPLPFLSTLLAMLAAVGIVQFRDTRRKPLRRVAPPCVTAGALALPPTRPTHRPSAGG